MKKLLFILLLALVSSLYAKSDEDSNATTFSEKSILASIESHFGDRIPDACYIGLAVYEEEGDVSDICMKALVEGKNEGTLISSEGLVVKFTTKLYFPRMLGFAKQKTMLEMLNVNVDIDGVAPFGFLTNSEAPKGVSVKTKTSAIVKDKKLDVEIFTYNNINNKGDFTPNYIKQAYEFARGDTPNLEKAFEYYKRAWISGDGRAMPPLALFYANGICVEKNMETALELMIDYGELNFTNEEKVLIYYILKNNLAVAKNDFIEKMLLVEKSHLSNRKKKNKVLEYFPEKTFEKMGAKFSFKKAFEWIEAQANAGDVEAQVFVSRAYKYSWGVPCDEEKSEKYRKLAFEAKHPIAIFDTGLALVEKSKDEGIALIKESFKTGYPFAYIYSFRDIISSKEDILTLESYSTDYPYVCGVIAEAYLKGMYVEADKEKAKAYSAKLSKFIGKMYSPEFEQGDFHKKLKARLEYELKSAPKAEEDLIIILPEN